MINEGGVTWPALWHELFRRQPSAALGLNYDPSHLVWQMMNHVAPLREFAGRIYHVHAKDVRIDRQRLNDVGILATPLEYHRPKLPGLGEIDWGRFCGELGDTGYSGPVCIEVEDRAYEATLASRHAALRQSGNYLRNFISDIRSKCWVRRSASRAAVSLDLAQLEIDLESEGLLAAFKAKYHAVFHKDWDTEKAKIAFALSQASRVMSEMEPATYRLDLPVLQRPRRAKEDAR